MTRAAAHPVIDRRRIEVRGIVQGVGFRPFIYRLAQELALSGWVRNDTAGVTLEVEGNTAGVERMAHRIATDAPALARVDAVTLSAPLRPRGDQAFAIVETGAGTASTMIGPDTAICDECLRELLDPADRRYRYAFINCTHCGPRYTITRALPYDRAMTSMAPFVQCRTCAAEYGNPRDRRFHAEPNACRTCGPELRLVDASGGACCGGDVIDATIARLRGGQIVGIKGLGGFHLACDARNASAVAALRARKHRDEKPFAVMMANVATARTWTHVSEAEARLLGARERPVVLLRKSYAETELVGVAPGLAWLGVMLPYTPLHYLLFHESAGRPKGHRWLDQTQDLVLVMTSANPGGEPLVIGNDEALSRLSGIADAFLVHDRDIIIRCDDTVARIGNDGAGQFVRRGRGYSPRAIALANDAPPVLAMGGHFKNAVCVTRGREAFLSAHVGDLDNPSTCTALDVTVAHLLSILQVEPALVVHDLHPDFYSSRLAVRLAHERGIGTLAVQHHHAHVAAVLAEHRVSTPALGLALDGVGLGTDGAAWGGELMRVSAATFHRLGHLAPLQLPGGDVAAREPWRMACAALARAGRGDEITRRFADQPAASTVAAMLARGINAPPTTSMGRWFDAAAGLLGVQPRMRFEGQAAMLLEGLAARYGSVASDPGLYTITADNMLDLTPLLMRLADLRDPGHGAALFHSTLIAALVDWVVKAARASGISIVACGGGCLLNAILARGVRDGLAARGIDMLEARGAPPNDGGLALGQAWVAHQALAKEST